MPAFERISSGVPGVDHVLDWIRLGDNVVWQVRSVDEYRVLAEPFARQALAEGRNTLYIRFAPHEPILKPQPGLTIHHLDPASGFESFTGELHRIIAEAGRGAFYVFDSISALQTAWAADLMMGNFFVVTCPYLFELDTVAWFCLFRHNHSYDTIARIRETTQILIDLFSDSGCLYIHPLKVWNRYSPTMFFPHRLDLNKPDNIMPLTDGVSVSRFYQLAADLSGLAGEEPALNLDSWERFFIDARKQAQNSCPDDTQMQQALVRSMAERLVGQDQQFLDLTVRNSTVRDMLEVRDRMIGSGMIGGKAAGMLLSRRIVGRMLPELACLIEPHDSWYIGSDVFYTYLVHNRLWKQRIAQRTDAGYFNEAPGLARGLLSGVFPDSIRQQFVRMLEYYGQNPIIVRSSSLLEDSFGHAFAGKYESVFCVNSGSPEDRLSGLEDAVRRVYASTMDESALAYRRQRGLQKQDEQMAILVQRVSGSLFGQYFMPALAGVGYSLSTWRWQSDLDPAAGMLRVVAGLGTRAVDRTGNDYPRLVSLDKPELDPSGGVARGRYGQHLLDCLDLGERCLAAREPAVVLTCMPDWLTRLLAEHDEEAENWLREQGKSNPVYKLTFPGISAVSGFPAAMRSILTALQQEYRYPVDIEFTVNWGEAGDFMVNLLQCRPLQTPGLAGKGGHDRCVNLDAAALAQRDISRIMLRLDRNTMGPQLDCQVDAVIIVDPRAYYELPYRNKPSVARSIGTVNRYYRDKGGCVMLLVPGRIGTSSPELGVPVSFAEISQVRMIFEIAYSEAGYQPELSWGSHFFQDLVESEIFYGAVPEEALTAGDEALKKGLAVCRLDFFNGEKELFAGLVPSSGLPEGLVRVYEPGGIRFLSDVMHGSCLCERCEEG